jgi:hypothetical protein
MSHVSLMTDSPCWFSGWINARNSGSLITLYRFGHVNLFIKRGESLFQRRTRVPLTVVCFYKFTVLRSQWNHTIAQVLHCIQSTCHASDWQFYTDAIHEDQGNIWSDRVVEKRGDQARMSKSRGNSLLQAPRATTWLLVCWTWWNLPGWPCGLAGCLDEAAIDGRCNLVC